MRQAKWIVAAAAFVVFTPFASASDEGAADTKAVTLRVRASDTGRPEDLFLLENAKEQRLSKTIEAIAPLGPGCPEWKTLFKQHLADELSDLRTKRKLPRNAALRVAPDPHLRFDYLATIQEAGKQAGFARVEFILPGEGELRVRVDRDGKMTLNGKLIATEDLKERLQTDVRDVGGDKVRVVIEAEPETKYSVVFSLLRLAQECGCTNVSLRAEKATPSYGTP